jgi:hypothetical protein
LSSQVSDIATQRASLLIGGEWTAGPATFPVHDKFTGAPIGEADRASKEQVAAAVAAARRSFETQRLTPYDRYRILSRVPELIETHREALVRTIVAETGFPVSDGANEVSRAVQTFIVSAEEAKRLAGEVVPIEASPGQSHRMAFTIRVPRGVVCGITSFNSPLKHGRAQGRARARVRQHRGHQTVAAHAAQRRLAVSSPAGGRPAARARESRTRSRRRGRPVADRRARRLLLHVHGQHGGGQAPSTIDRAASGRARTRQHRGDDRLRRRRSRARGAALRQLGSSAAPARRARRRRSCSSTAASSIGSSICWSRPLVSSASAIRAIARRMSVR